MAAETDKYTVFYLVNPSRGMQARNKGFKKRRDAVAFLKKQEKLGLKPVIYGPPDPKFALKTQPRGRKSPSRGH